MLKRLNIIIRDEEEKEIAKYFALLLYTHSRPINEDVNIFVHVVENITSELVESLRGTYVYIFLHYLKRNEKRHIDRLLYISSKLSYVKTDNAIIGRHNNHSAVSVFGGYETPYLFIEKDPKEFEIEELTSTSIFAMWSVAIKNGRALTDYEEKVKAFTEYHNKIGTSFRVVYNTIMDSFDLVIKEGGMILEILKNKDVLCH